MLYSIILSLYLDRAVFVDHGTFLIDCTLPISDDEVMKQLLRESPQGLIKFQMYSKKDEQRYTDRRLNRIKNKNAIPLGPWAHTVIEGTFFELYAVRREKLIIKLLTIS